MSRINAPWQLYLSYSDAQRQLWLDLRRSYVRDLLHADNYCARCALRYRYGSQQSADRHCTVHHRRRRHRRRPGPPIIAGLSFDVLQTYRPALLFMIVPMSFGLFGMSRIAAAQH